MDFGLFRSLEETIYNGLQCGSILGYPLMNCKVIIKGKLDASGRIKNSKFEIKITMRLNVNSCLKNIN